MTSVEEGLPCHNNIFGGGYTFAAAFIWHRDGHNHVEIRHELDVVLRGQCDHENNDLGYYLKTKSQGETYRTFWCGLSYNRDKLFTA